MVGFSQLFARQQYLKGSAGLVAGHNVDPAPQAANHAIVNGRKIDAHVLVNPTQGPKRWSVISELEEVCTESDIVSAASRHGRPSTRRSGAGAVRSGRKRRFEPVSGRSSASGRARCRTAAGSPAGGYPALASDARSNGWRSKSMGHGTASRSSGRMSSTRRFRFTGSRGKRLTAAECGQVLRQGGSPMAGRQDLLQLLVQGTAFRGSRQGEFAVAVDGGQQRFVLAGDSSHDSCRIRCKGGSAGGRAASLGCWSKNR